jgi:hypothetical protein
MGADPRKTAIQHWALKADTGELLTCNDQVTYDNKKTASACGRELEMLGGSQQRAKQCPHGDHWHLTVPDYERLSRNQERARTLIHTLLAAPNGEVERRELRDTIDWGDTSGRQQREHFQEMLAVLEKYRLIIRDDIYVTVDDQPALAGLVRD